MVMTTPSTAATMPSPGSESAMVVKPGHWLRRLMMMDFHVRIQHLIQIEYFHAAAHRHAHGVADESHGMMIFREIFVFRDERALVRLLDVRFQRHQPFLARFLQQFVHHLQRST
jgi:hypothetical protein